MGLFIGFIAGLLQGMVGFGAGIILMIYLPTIYTVTGSAAITGSYFDCSFRSHGLSVSTSYSSEKGIETNCSLYDYLHFNNYDFFLYQCFLFKESLRDIFSHLDML